MSTAIRNGQSDLIERIGLYKPDSFNHLFSQASPMRGRAASITHACVFAGLTGGLAMTIAVPAEGFDFDTVPVHDATRLTAGGPLARIVLNGQVYSLRITRAGKLILTK
jgi:hypothetical protein